MGLALTLATGVAVLFTVAAVVAPYFLIGLYSKDSAVEEPASLCFFFGRLAPHLRLTGKAGKEIPCRLRRLSVSPFCVVRNSPHLNIEVLIFFAQITLSVLGIPDCIRFLTAFLACFEFPQIPQFSTIFLLDNNIL